MFKRFFYWYVEVSPGGLGGLAGLALCVLIVLMWFLVDGLLLGNIQDWV